MTTPANEQPSQVSSSATIELHIPAPAIAQISAVPAPPETEKISEIADATDATDAAVATPAPETEIDAATVIPASAEKPEKPAKRLFAVSGIEGFVNSKKHGKPFAVMRTKGHLEVLAIGSPELDARIRAQARKKGKPLKQREVQETNDELRSQAEEHGIEVDLYPRVSPLKDGGVEIDLNDGSGTTVLITAKGVEIAKGTSETLFIRASSSLPLPLSVKTAKPRRIGMTPLSSGSSLRPDPLVARPIPCATAIPTANNDSTKSVTPSPSASTKPGKPPPSCVPRSYSGKARLRIARPNA
jgi:hypothetical protein